MDFYFELINFPMARSVFWRAGQILKKRSNDERIAGGDRLQELVYEFSQERLNEEVAEFVGSYSTKLVEHGGWELGYFPDHFRDERGVYHISRADAASILENWPDSGNPPDGYPDEPMSDIDSLGEILCSGYPYDDLAECRNLTEWECYALMADTKIREVHFLLKRAMEDRHGLDQIPPAKLLNASRWITAAMEFVCYAERLLWDTQMTNLSTGRRLKDEVQLRRDIRRSFAQDAARQKLANDPKQADKTMVRECWEIWQKEPNRYKGKAAFSRDMLSKYESLESQRVIERWCKEWESVPF